MMIETPLSVLIIFLLLLFWLAYDGGRLQKENKELKFAIQEGGE